MAKQRIRPSDGQPSNKHVVVDYFLSEPENFDPEVAHKRYPGVDLTTIVSWESVWRNWDKSTFTGSDGFPRGMADSARQIALIKSAIQRARSARGAGRRTTIKRRKISPAENFAGELAPKQKYVEGALSQVLVNRFERDPNARAACLQLFGYSCSVCEMNFADCYGKIGGKFIHVHHLNPLALRRESYEPDPSKDLLPVCPNCHAMLHTSDPPLDVDELRTIWQKRHHA